MIETTTGLIVEMATLSKIFTGAVVMAYLTSKRLTAVNQAHLMDMEIAIQRMYGVPLTKEESKVAGTVTIWWEFTKEAVTVFTVSKSLDVARWAYR